MRSATIWSKRRAEIGLKTQIPALGCDLARRKCLLRQEFAMSEGPDYHVSIGDDVLHVVEQGDGLPVLVPTGGGSRFYRNTFSSHLTQSLRLIYVSMRGTDGSSGSVENLSFVSMADDLDRVRDALGCERIVVLGHSNHGCIAMEYARRHPQHTLAVLPIATTPDFTRSFSLGLERFEKEATTAQRANLARRREEFEALDKSKLDPDEVAIRNYVSLSPLGWRDLSLDIFALWGGIPTGAAAYLQALGKFGPTWNFVPHLHEIDVPVLVISGRYDYLCPVELWIESLHELPYGRLEVFESSAHNPQFEESDHFDSIVIDFVRANSA